MTSSDSSINAISPGNEEQGCVRMCSDRGVQDIKKQGVLKYTDKDKEFLFSV